jgi:rhamnosyltransferase
MKKVAAVVVTHHPRADELLPLLERLSSQADKLIVVDNTPGARNAELETLIGDAAGQAGCTLIRQGENLGLARALNEGCRLALESGADFILLSDQDSLPAENMVHELHRAYEALTEAGFEVGAVGPTYTDLHTGLTYPFQAQLPGRHFYGHALPSGDAPHVEALTLITSGTLIPAAVFEEVGPMREDFFIDQIDIEWCHRARARGYRLFGTGWATMFQRMGEARLKVWYLRWRSESAYGPTRIYYRLRNFVALLKLDYIDWRWKLRSCWYHLGLLYAHVFFGPEPAATLRMFFRGVWDGLRNRMGPAGGKDQESLGRP